MLAWLSCLSFRTPYDQRCEEHLEGTGSWFLNSEIYQEWKTGEESDLLWVKGKPGCGKSVLAAVTVTDLKLEIGPEVAFAFAFCQSGDESSQNATTIFSALTRQICQQQPDINTILKSEFTASHLGEMPSMKAVRTIMKSALSRFDKTFLLIDAIDECEKNNQLAEELVELVQSTMISCVKIIVFSRPDFYLKNWFEAYKQAQPDLGANEEDLKSYIDSRFQDDSQATVNREIREECIVKADGMFLWVKLLADNLQKPLTSKQKLRRIKDIPPGLGSLYDSILNDVCKQDEDVRSTAFLVLIWVTHACRPLTRSEMLEAVADYSEAMTVGEADKQSNAEDLVAICANLVFIDKDGCFRLCHESVRAYLDEVAVKTTGPMAEYQQQKHNAQRRIAEICLTYMLRKDFEYGPARSRRRLDTLVKKYPFLGYAAKFWGTHLSQETLPALQDLILEFVLSPSRRELSMQFCLYDPLDDSDIWNILGSSNPLHILSFFGLKQIAETLQDARALLQQPDRTGATPLIYALTGRNYEMSIWLIEQIESTQGLILHQNQKIRAIHLCSALGWADVLKRLLSEDDAFVNSTEDKTGPTPLTRACWAGEKEAAATLIDHKASVNLKDGIGGTPLTVSVFGGQPSLVDLLLDKGADPNCRDADGVTPLHHAATTGNAAVAKALLSKKADPLATLPNCDDQTPFHIAAECQAVEVIRALHCVHPKLDMKSESGYTPLHIAAWDNSAEAAEALLELGAPKDEVDANNRTALFIAAHEGNLDTVQVLAEAGCDVNIEAWNGTTAIHAAAESGKISVVRCILRCQPVENWKALVNKRSSKETPIHAATRGGNAEIVKFLLKAGADGTANGIFNSSALHNAAHLGHKEMSRILLKATKEANPRNGHGQTPLHFAARVGNLDFIVQYFQDCSEFGLFVEIDAQDIETKTALTRCLDARWEDVAKFLLGTGAVSKPDVNGNYPIHLAAWHGFDSIVQKLLTHGGVTSGGYLGRTPLLISALRGHLKSVKLLLPLSKDILNTKDEFGATPVMAALSNRHLEVANYLLDNQADYSTVDENGYTMLHLAARVGDTPMVQRLLKLGCKGNVMNRYGNTPFHLAVLGGSIKVIEALIAAGFNGIDIPSSIGDYCSHFAAEEGNLEMLQKLNLLGAKLGCCNLLGRTPAFMAAANGHLEILQFLKESGESLHLPDLEGNTPLIAAAGAGCPEAVKFLLQSQAHGVNDYSTWSQQSPLINAAFTRFPLTIECLLAAGADPYHRDAYGLNALDYAACHRPSLQAMHKWRHFHDPDTLEAQGEVLRDTIRYCCTTLLPESPELSVAELFHRLSMVCNLARALVRVQDYNSAKLCCMELFWRPKSDPLDWQFYCDICCFSNTAGDKYVCTSCLGYSVLCKKCHWDYTEAGKTVPEALEVVVHLEKQVQPVRAAISDLSLVHASRSMSYFEAGREWISMLLHSYEAWEEKYNANNEYRELKRPGQELLKIIKETDELKLKTFRTGIHNPEDKKTFEKLVDEYKAYRRNHKADKEIVDFICKDHDYFVVSADEQEKLKLAGLELDSVSGRLTTSFLQALLDKYKHNSSTEATIISNKDSDWAKEWPSETGLTSTVNFSNPSGARKTLDEQASRSRSLDRSSTPTVRNPARRYGVAVSMASSIGRTAPGPSHFPEGKGPIRLRRVRTSPTLRMETNAFQTQNFRVGMTDTRVATVAQTHLDPEKEETGSNLPISHPARQTVMKTVNLSFPTDPNVRSDRCAVQPAPVKEISPSRVGASGKPLPDEPVLTSTLSSEPEPTLESRTAQKHTPPTEARQATATNGGKESNDSGNNEADQEVTDCALRAAYAIYDDKNADGCEEDFSIWIRALNVTDIMQPGFKAGCIRFLLDRGEEDEDVPEPKRKQEEKHIEDEDESSFEDFSDAEVIDCVARQQPDMPLGSDERLSSLWA